MCTAVRAQQAADALCTKNFEGETPLLHAAGAPEPGAFLVIAKALSANEVRRVANTQHDKRQQN